MTGPPRLDEIATVVALTLGAIAAFVLWRTQAIAGKGSLADVVMPAICDHLALVRRIIDRLHGVPG